MNKQLTVAKAYPNDIGRGIARIDPHILMVLHLMQGDIIEIAGLKSTVAKVRRAVRKDLKENIIRIDGFIRQNAGVSVGDDVQVKKASVKPAEKVVLDLPEGSPIQFKGNALDAIKSHIMNRPICKGDIVPVISTMAHPFDAIPLIAIEAEPGVVLITEKTEITMGVITAKD